MKVLECCSCHRYFKSSDDHVTVYIERENRNYCTECSIVLFSFAIEGQMKAFEDKGNKRIDDYVLG